eukprot:m.140085 g.140085  ORF g.140085 m.140085 type:complete len:51 (-) comp17074_c0_seq4:1180-1332(-)
MPPAMSTVYVNAQTIDDVARARVGCRFVARHPQKQAGSLLGQGPPAKTPF